VKRRFDFRLERVRRVRDVEERVARAERARAEELARAAETARDEARSVLERSRAWLSTLLEGRLEPGHVLASQRALDAELAQLRRRVESARTVRAQAEHAAAEHRERKSAARALEELRERNRRQHAAELEKSDNAVLDEVAQRLAERERGARDADERGRNPEGASSPTRPPADQTETPSRDRAP